jgi:transcription termination factor Rho
MTQKELSAKTVAELKKIATDLGITGLSKKTKTNLVEDILSKTITAQPEVAKPASVETKMVEESYEKPTKVSEAKQVEEVKPAVIQQVAPNSTTVAPKPQMQYVPPKAMPTGNANTNRPINQQNNQNLPQQLQQNKQNNQNPRQTQNQQSNHQNGQNQGQSQTNNQQQGQQNSSQIQGNQQQNQQFSNETTVEVTGVLDIVSDNTHGVLRSHRLVSTNKDTYISISQVKKLKLRKGDMIVGVARLPKENERYYSLLWIKTVNGTEINDLKDRPNFDELKPVYPNKQIKLEIGQYPIANRILDILAPIGFGQRAMIVAPPKSGKTFLIKDIAKGINENYPDSQLMVVLVGERPEEVTDIERSVNGIVYASNFDEAPGEQVQVAELSLERAKRMVELGQDVIILMDSLTRLARAYNVALPASGRTLSGGLDPVALYPSKRFFGAARNFENGASLTIIATSLVETGSKMDDVIFEEFKGTGNMELKLDRRLSNKRVFPAIDLLESGTRNEELLLGTDALQNSWKIRRLLESLGDDANYALSDRMKSTKTNEEFLNTLHQY